MNYQTDTTATLRRASRQPGPHARAGKEDSSESPFGQQVQDHSVVRAGGGRRSRVVPVWELSPATGSKLETAGSRTKGREPMAPSLASWQALIQVSPRH